MRQLWDFFVQQDWSESLVAWGTVVLAAVTALLAWYTKQLADVTMRPSIVATLEPSRWSVRHFDLHVVNEGTAAAFDIRVTFEPPLDLHNVKDGDPQPLTEISILRTGQRMTSFVAGFEDLEDKAFAVRVSWSRKPKRSKREELKYDFDMKSFGGVSFIGSDPAVQIAEEMKNLRKLVQGTISGNRLSVDIYSSGDRERANDAIRARIEAQRAARQAATKEPDA
jgi:hypothetical protein